MTCGDVSDLLDTFVDAELPASMLLSVARHAAECPACDAVVRELTALHEVVERVTREDGDALDLDAVWTGIEAGMDRVDARRAWTRRVRTLPAWGVAFAAAASAVLWLRAPEPTPQPERSAFVDRGVVRRPRPNMAVIDRLNSEAISRVAISRERKLGTTLIMVSGDGNEVP
jgi:anti-sigma factor RsiW